MVNSRTSCQLSGSETSIWVRKENSATFKANVSCFCRVFNHPSSSFYVRLFYYCFQMCLD